MWSGRLLPQHEWQAKSYEWLKYSKVVPNIRIVVSKYNFTTKFEPHFSALPSANHLLEIIACACEEGVLWTKKLRSDWSFCNWNLLWSINKMATFSKKKWRNESREVFSGYTTFQCWKLKRLPVQGKNHLRTVWTKLQGISTYHILLIPHQFIGS